MPQSNSHIYAALIHYECRWPVRTNSLSQQLFVRGPFLPPGSIAAVWTAVAAVMLSTPPQTSTDRQTLQTKTFLVTF